MNPLDAIIAANRAGAPALPSVCSAHEDVLEASLRLAETLDRPLLVEATSNQVNQFGGYTGMKAADFTTFVHAICDRAGVDRARVLFGGDHLGPQAWKAEPAEDAMAKARDMMRAYVEAGFTKIHLDCSEGCAGEPAQLGDGIVAARAADLAEICELAAPDPGALRYIIGTEVPPPGGARSDEHGIVSTPPARALATLKTHRDAFAARGLDAAWSRIRGLVLQPGLEFAPAHIDRFDIERPDDLSPVLDGHDLLCFEAHSTDYQLDAVYPDLARRHFALLKVGPALTYAWREALYGLSHIHGWMSGAPHISEEMERLMLASPGYWQGHLHGDPDQQKRLRHFGYSDRIRYYWPQAQGAVATMLEALEGMDPPEPLLAQYLPPDTLEIAETLPLPWPRAMLLASVQGMLLPYFAAPGE
ncbi:class II D-tagatose-bisphosphate aldolase, non-catalytic subunit [Tropicimonas sp. TH_r6]|uniref:class II D-tagatose-bisphosphate aldolase, non-catalytic subunit n=1 Tax=Tropicimonas sp. TH_r6 TaxID=3082085 RepID=UPI002954A7E6|nr:class II D-tagatose-bisphosphate aldolase, non-catalytic subunit [Tropicimonas sp. TH_r6]MDV7141450.1 class II D-tagatose-bisphosphate aldolase, non-catalytic subunit [Tropicimonas sp. TH_r6]